MSEINITLPDGSVRQYPKGTTAMQIAQGISEGLARVIIAAKVNGQVVETSRPIMSARPPAGNATMTVTFCDG